MPMVSISINPGLSREVRAAVIGGRAIEAIQNRVARELYTTWIDAASGRQLPGMTYAVDSSTYRSGIQRPTINRETGEITMVADLPGWAQKMEVGHGPIDMKPRLLANAHSNSKGVKSRVIPIHNDSGAFPVMVQYHLRKVPRQSRTPGAAVPGFSRNVSQERPKSIPAKYWNRATRGAVGLFRRNVSQRHLGWGATRQRNRGFADYQRQNGNMVGARYDTVAGNGIVSFRTVSSKSAPGSWVLPGKPANPIRAAVVADVTRRLPSLLR